MSLSTQTPLPEKNLLAGLHLVVITDVAPVKGDDQKPISSEKGGMKVRCTFTKSKDGVNTVYEHDFWVKDGFFARMCHAFKIDPLAPKFRTHVLGTQEKPNLRRGWIAIKEIHHINGTEIVLEGGQPVIEYELFDFFRWTESGKRPKVAGDPELGAIAGVFLDYKDVNLNPHKWGEADMTIGAELIEKEEEHDEFSLEPIVATENHSGADPGLVKKYGDMDMVQFSEHIHGKKLYEEKPFTPLSEQNKPKTGPIGWDTF